MTALDARLEAKADALAAWVWNTQDTSTIEGVTLAIRAAIAGLRKEVGR